MAVSAGTVGGQWPVAGERERTGGRCKGPGDRIMVCGLRCLEPGGGRLEELMRVPCTALGNIHTAILLQTTGDCSHQLLDSYWFRAQPEFHFQLPEKLVRLRKQGVSYFSLGFSGNISLSIDWVFLLYCNSPHCAIPPIASTDSMGSKGHYTKCFGDVYQLYYNASGLFVLH